VSTLTAALSGVSFALIPVGIRAGATRGIEPRLLLVIAMPLCALAMLPGTLRAPGPPAAWLAGACNGIEQFAAVLVLRWGLRHGPMAPLWSAQMLSFVAVVLWAWLAWGEVPHTGHWLAMLAALASVTVAAQATGGAAGAPTRMLPYAVALVTLWTLNGATNATFKHLETLPAPGGGTLMSAHGDAVMLAMYATITVGAAIDLALRPVRARVGATFGCAVVVAAGSLGGLLLLRNALSGPSATVFTAMTGASLLAAAAFAWIIWRERPGRAGWISLVCALLAVAAASC